MFFNAPLLFLCSDHPDSLLAQGRGDTYQDSCEWEVTSKILCQPTCSCSSFFSKLTLILFSLKSCVNVKYSPTVVCQYSFFIHGMHIPQLGQRWAIQSYVPRSLHVYCTEDQPTVRSQLYHILLTFPTLIWMLKCFVIGTVD